MSSRRELAMTAVLAATAILMASPLMASPLMASPRLEAAPAPLTTGGAPVGGLAPAHKRRPVHLRPPSSRSHGHWLGGVTVTEYWPAPERWFVGRLVKAPGLAGKHRIDWLYSALGVSMEGDGIGLDRRRYHLEQPGRGGWVTRAGAPTSPGDGWAAGAPYWRAGGYWRNRSAGVTFPLLRGGWSNGPGLRYVPLRGVTFAPGPSLPLRFYRSIAVDPAVIPLGSLVYIPAYEHDGHGGWFLAQDTGAAIRGRHLDVYRRPPRTSSSSGRYLTGQRIYVVEPHR